MKRGISTVVASILLILLAIAAIVIIWVILRGFLQKSAGRVETSCLTLDLEIGKAQINTSSNILYVQVKRGSGEGDLSRIRFRITNSSESIIRDRNTSMNELETKSFSFDNIGNISVISKVEIAGVISLNEEEKICGIASSKNIFEVYSPPPEGCTPNNNACSGKECGTVANGTCGNIGCGNCQTGYICTNEQCELEIPSSCGNNIKEGIEECDGADFGGVSCASLGVQQGKNWAGNLICNNDCTFNLSRCSEALTGLYNYNCGNEPPRIIWNGTKYQLWYTIGRDNPDDIPDHGSIWYGESDNGVDWYNNQMVIPKGSGGIYSGYRSIDDYPWVIKEDSTYKIWYSIYNMPYVNWAFSIAYRTSTNGISWNSPVYIFSTYDENPNIAKFNNKYYMIYEHRYPSYAEHSYVFVLRLAQSSDGISWSTQDLITNVHDGDANGCDWAKCGPAPYLIILEDSTYPYILTYNRRTNCNICERYYIKTKDFATWTEEKPFFSLTKKLTTFSDPNLGITYLYDTTCDNSVPSKMIKSGILEYTQDGNLTIKPLIV